MPHSKSGASSRHLNVLTCFTGPGSYSKSERKSYRKYLQRKWGKVIAEARGEVQEGIDMAFFMAGEGRRLVGDTTPSELPNKFAMSVRAPVGIAGLITPWNFPIAIATWKAFPAIVGGNAVVWKPATETPVLANMLVGILEEAGLPKGVMNLVYGSGKSSAKRWLSIRISTSFPLPGRPKLGAALQRRRTPLKTRLVGNGREKTALSSWTMPT